MKKTVFFGLLIHALIVAGSIIYTGSELMHADATIAQSKRGVAAKMGTRQESAQETPKIRDRIRIQSLNTDTSKDHVLGNKDAAVTLFSFVDYECPYCASFFSTAKDFVQHNSGVNLVIRHFPLANHKNAMHLAETAECVSEQTGDNGFYDFSERAFRSIHNSNPKLNPSQNALLSLTGINANKINNCASSGKHEKKILGYMEEARRIGIDGTPTTIIFNNKERTYEVLTGNADTSTLQDRINSISNQ